MQPVEAEEQCLRSPLYLECGSGADEDPSVEDSARSDWRLMRGR